MTDRSFERFGERPPVVQFWYNPFYLDIVDVWLDPPAYKGLPDPRSGLENPADGNENEEK